MQDLGENDSTTMWSTGATNMDGVQLHKIKQEATNENHIDAVSINSISFSINNQ